MNRAGGWLRPGSCREAKYATHLWEMHEVSVVDLVLFREGWFGSVCLCLIIVSSLFVAMTVCILTFLKPIDWYLSTISRDAMLQLAPQWAVLRST